MNNPAQMDYVERLFVRSCLECSPEPHDHHHCLPFELFHSGSFAYSQLYQLKNKMLYEALKSPVEVLAPEKICGLANQAAKQAWNARFPVLVFPCIFHDILRQAREQFAGNQARPSHEAASVGKNLSL